MVCRPKDQGGLGIHDLQVKNEALLSKWLFKLLTEDGVWQTMLRNKYIGQKAVSQAYWTPGDSHFWAGLMAAKKHLFRFGSFAIRDGSEVRFWEDIWLGNASLREQYPALYNIAREKKILLRKVLSSSPPNISFRRDLIGPRLMSWHNLLSRLDSINIRQGRDVFCWNLTTSGSFTVDSMYRALMHSEVPMSNNKKIWKSKIPLKVKIFMWYLRRGVVLTKDNLARRNWPGSKKCCFCTHDETIKHLFFNASLHVLRGQSFK